MRAATMLTCKYSIGRAQWNSADPSPRIKQMLLFSRNISDVRVDAIDKQIKAKANQEHHA